MTAAARTLILAGSFSEAAKYARGKQLRSYRYAVNAAAVGSYQATDIVELPGYESRRDKFAFQSAIRNLLRRGVEVRKDNYTPPPLPPAPQYGDAEYVADPLLGDVPSPDVLREIGVTDAEVERFTDIAETAARLNEVLTPGTDAMSNLIAGVSDALQQKQDDFVESAPKRRGRPPGSKNKPRVNAPKSPAEVDDLFED